MPVVTRCIQRLTRTMLLAVGALAAFAGCLIVVVALWGRWADDRCVQLGRVRGFTPQVQSLASTFPPHLRCESRTGQVLSVDYSPTWWLIGAGVSIIAILLFTFLSLRRVWRQSLTTQT